MSLQFPEPRTEERLNHFETNEILDEDQWEALSALLVQFLAERLPPNFSGLSDYAVSREGIYADHP
ncbi:MAG: hypothetical protein ACOYNY_25170 [Caldilineaceae bacterium]|jgi:hypothetical protein